MAAKFLPCGDRVLVSVREQERLIEGVLLPDSAKEDMQVGIIVSVGEKTIFKEGELVLFGPWAGKNIQLEGIPFRVMLEGEIDGKIIYAGS